VRSDWGDLYGALREGGVRGGESPAYGSCCEAFVVVECELRFLDDRWALSKAMASTKAEKRCVLEASNRTEEPGQRSICAFFFFFFFLRGRTDCDQHNHRHVRGERAEGMLKLAEPGLEMDGRVIAWRDQASGRNRSNAARWVRTKSRTVSVVQGPIDPWRGRAGRDLGDAFETGRSGAGDGGSGASGPARPDRPRPDRAPDLLACSFSARTPGQAVVERSQISSLRRNLSIAGTVGRPGPQPCQHHARPAPGSDDHGARDAGARPTAYPPAAAPAVDRVSFPTEETGILCCQVLYAGCRPSAQFADRVPISKQKHADLAHPGWPLRLVKSDTRGARGCPRWRRTGTRPAPTLVSMGRNSLRSPDVGRCASHC